MRKAAAIVACVVAPLMGSACSGSSSGSPSASHCTPPPGGRCAGPAPITTQLTVDASGRQISGVFQCGGTLAATESERQVTLTYRASAVRAGGLTCALIRVSVSLEQPLGNRTVVDGTTHATLHVSG